MQMMEGTRPSLALSYLLKPATPDAHRDIGVLHEMLSKEYKENGPRPYPDDWKVLLKKISSGVMPDLERGADTDVAELLRYPLTTRTMRVPVETRPLQNKVEVASHMPSKPKSTSKQMRGSTDIDAAVH